jgi:hypothetical protein
VALFLLRNEKQAEGEYPEEAFQIYRNPYISEYLFDSQKSVALQSWNLSFGMLQMRTDYVPLPSCSKLLGMLRLHQSGENRQEEAARTSKVPAQAAQEAAGLSSL